MSKKIILSAAIMAVLQSTEVRADDALAYAVPFAKSEEMPLFGFKADLLQEDTTYGGVHEYEEWFYDGDTAWEV